jgi:hypothetical protein
LQSALEGGAGRAPRFDRDVSGELHDGFSLRAGSPQVFLHLDDRVADLDIDPAAASDSRLQDDLVEVRVVEVEVAGEQQSANVSS